MEGEDKTGHVSPKEVICLFYVIFQELFQKYRNLIGWAEARRYLASSAFKKGNICRHLSFSSFRKIDTVCNRRNRVSKTFSGQQSYSSLDVRTCSQKQAKVLIRQI